MDFVSDASTWNQIIAELPNPHCLQSWEWGEFKSRYGWQARRVVWGTDAAAQVLTRTAWRGAARVLYVPKGPALDWSNASLRARVLDDLRSIARRENAILIKIDPEVPRSSAPAELELGEAVTGDLRLQTWRLSPDQIQFRNTAILDLARDEAGLLAGMKSKTRYNIRL